MVENETPPPSPHIKSPQVETTFLLLDRTQQKFCENWH